MRDRSRNLLLVGAGATPATTLHILSATADHTDGPLAVPVSSMTLATPPRRPYDVALLALPVGAAANLNHVLDWTFVQLAPAATLLAPETTLIAAAVGDCFPPACAEVVLGAGGFTPLSSSPASAAALLAAVPAEPLETWCRAVDTTLPALARTAWLAATPAPGFSFITPSIAADTLEANLLRSRAVRSPRNELLIERRGPRVQAALNAGLDRAANDCVIVLHEDVYLPPLWEGMFRRSLRLVEAGDPGWGVLGCAGVRRRVSLWRVRRRGVGHARENATMWGEPFDAPEPVDTLDEFLIAFRQSRGLRFDEGQPNYHFYGTDLCLQAAARGHRSYAVEAFCYHNARPRQPRDAGPAPDFLAGCDYIRDKWSDRLPIVTSCTIIQRNPMHDHHMRRRRRAARLWLAR